MSWLWGKKEMDEVEEKLIEKGEETLDEILQDDVGNSTDVGNPHGRGNNESDDKRTKKDVVYCDDEGSSDESSLKSISYDDDDDDDDSLVVDLIESMSTDDESSDDDISIIEDTHEDASDILSESDGDDEDEVLSAQSPNRGGKDNTKGNPSNETEQYIPTTKNKDNSSNDQQTSIGDADNDDPVASFWEKQSLLVLAAEHDRVDILKALIKDENEEKDALLNSGIPPLHLAISFGSVNTAQSLLRMGADPSVRPNIDVVLEERKNQPKDSKVDIPNIRRFEMITAWELAFGNALYEEKAKSKKKSTPWSLFGSTTNDGATTNRTTNDQIMKPVDMAPSKREGIRHAFTAEALRSVGSDEVDRLRQLVYSGMPANIDIGGKDLYGWAVEMGALQCEEFLRPVEAAKYDEKANNGGENTTSSLESSGGDISVTKTDEEIKKSSSFVVHRPDAEETIPQLKNRLDELDSLAMALSICLDNLAEEVSVCHGLLLMGGGASALASHVRSLRDLKARKLYDMENTQLDCLDAERELTDLVHSTGDIGKEIANMANSNFLTGGFYHRVMLPSNKNNGRLNTGPGQTESNSDSLGDQEAEEEQLNIKAQVAASENKIRKLRASIADLSEENTRDLKEVKRRGLEGGINLVRGLREELRDIEYNLSEARSMKTACKAKISMILARVPNQENKNTNANSYSDAANTTIKPEFHNERSESKAYISNEIVDVKRSTDSSRDIDEDGNPSEIHATPMNEIPKQNNSEPPTTTPAPLPRHGNSQGNKIAEVSINKISASTKIAGGDSRAIAIIQPGNKGFFTVDLWEVLLRIIGYERAANHRSVQNATKSTSSSRPNVMII